MSKKAKKAVKEDTQKVAYVFSYCAGCGSRQMIKNKCRNCGYVPPKPVGT